MIPVTFLFSEGAVEPSLNPWAGLGLGLLLVLLNGFFVAAEFALAKVRATQIEPQALRGERRAKVALHMLRHLDAYLSATQLGITLASIALGWVGEPAFAWILRPLVHSIPGATPELEHSIALTTAFVFISILHIVFGELVPKSVASRCRPPPPSPSRSRSTCSTGSPSPPSGWITGRSIPRVTCRHCSLTAAKCSAKSA